MINLNEIKTKFGGKILMPNDDGYEAASTVMMGKGTPAIVFLPQTAQDVALAIAYAKENSLALSVRSGGHGALASGTNNGGAIINLGLMKKVELLDADKHLVRIETGNIWIEAATALQQHGLALSSGDTTTPGVGGLTLGGGIGWMVRKFGLTIDSMVGAEIVTADGKIRYASEQENPDLFWAIRGGGGNFGVVTHFDFIAHPVGKVYYGAIMFDPADLKSVITGLRNHLRTASNDLTVITNYISANLMGGNPEMLMVSCCVASDDESVMKSLIDPILKFGKVLSNGITLRNYPEVMEQAHPPTGEIKIITHNVIVNDFSDEIIHEIADIKTSGSGIVLQIRNLGGAIKNVPVDATAFAHRQGEAMLLSPVFLKSDATDEQIAQALKPWQRLQKFGNGAYVQFISLPTPEAIALVYPKPTFDRLLQIKKTVDPDNLFHLNLNIQ